MSETWLLDALKRPATYDPAFPSGKHGYTGVPARPLGVIEFVVNHDARGYRGYLNQGHRPGESASWTFTIQTDGILLQHLPLEAVAWTSGNFGANFRGIGCEHENETGPWGVPQPYPFTPAQLVTEARLYTSLQGLCPNIGAPRAGEGVRLHRLVAPGSTTCPNGRDRYTEYDKLLAQPGPPEEDIMATLAELDALIDKKLEAYKPAVRQLCAEAIDRFMRGDSDPATQRIARQATLDEAIVLIKKL